MYFPMKQDISIMHKRGFNINSIDCILVKADINTINSIFTEYFELKVFSNCHPRKYLKLYNKCKNKHLKLESILRIISEKERDKIKNRISNLLYPSPIWKFLNHNWSVLSFNGNQYDIAFAFSTLLNTDVVTYWIPKHDNCRELKLFRSNKLVEHYQFGSQCGQARDNYWDAVIDLRARFRLESHRFCSSIRQVTAGEIKQAIEQTLGSSDNYGFLDDCVKYYDAYFPREDESPFNYIYPQSNSTMRKFQNNLERMDIVMLPYSWSYQDWKVPQEVSKN